MHKWMIVAMALGSTACDAESVCELSAEKALAGIAEHQSTYVSQCGYTWVHVAFDAELAGEPWNCSSRYNGVSESDKAVVPLDLRFYMHDLRLELASGEEVSLDLEPDGQWQSHEVVLLDFEDRSGTCANGTLPTNKRVIGRFKGEGKPIGLSFRLGVPLELNHNLMTSAPPPLNVSGLYWSWLGGYKFLRLDLEHADADTAQGGEIHGVGAFSVHIGSTGCEIDPRFGKVMNCERENRGLVQLEGWKDKVVLDISTLLDGVPFGEFGAIERGCMSTLEESLCPPIFEHLGIDFSSGAPKLGESSAFDWR